MNRIPMPSSAAPARPRGAGATPQGAPRPFTLIEMLFVISIILIVLGTAVNGQKRLAREAALTTRYAALQQLVNDTMMSAKRMRVPMQISLQMPSDPLSQPCKVYGGTGTLVSYFGFNDTDNSTGLIVNNGMFNQHLYVSPAVPVESPAQVPAKFAFTSAYLADGYLGKGLCLTGAPVELESWGGNQYDALVKGGNAYMEAWIKPSYNEMADGSSVTILDIGPSIVLTRLQNGAGFGIYGTTGTENVPREPAWGGYIATIPSDNQWHKVGLRLAMDDYYYTGSNWDAATTYHRNPLTLTRVLGAAGNVYGPFLCVVSDSTPGAPPVDAMGFPSTGASEWTTPNKYSLRLYLDDRLVDCTRYPFRGSPSYRRSLRIGFSTRTGATCAYRGLIDEIRIINYGIGNCVESDPRDSTIIGSSSIVNIAPTGTPETNASFSMVSTLTTGSMLGWYSQAMANAATQTLGPSLPSNYDYIPALRATINSPGGFTPQNGFISIGCEILSYESLVWNPNARNGTTLQACYEFTNCQRGQGGTTLASASMTDIKPARPVMMYRSGGGN